MNNTDKILRIFSRLASLRNNLPTRGFGIENSYVIQYNNMLNDLEKEAVISLEEFKIPSNRVNAEPYIFHMDGSSEYTREKYCDREYFLSQIEALLEYLKIRFSPRSEEKDVGFNTKE